MMAAFSLTKELALSADISLAAWCPTMDLCAVVNVDGQLALHRMDWQQLWAVAPASPVTAICWRPDGKQIAAGHANGALSLLDVESGATLAEHKVHFARVRCMAWADQAAAASAGAAGSDTAAAAAARLLAAASQQQQPDSSGVGPPQLQQQLASVAAAVAPHVRYRRLFAPPLLEPPASASSEPAPHPYDLSMEAPEPAPWPAERPGLSLLLAGDVRGRVSMWLGGQVQLAEVAGNLAAHGDADDDDDTHEPLQLLQIAASSGLDQLLMVVQSKTRGLLVVSHSLGVLQRHQQPLQQCAALFSQLQSFLQAAVKCIEVCASDWRGVHGDFSKAFDAQLTQELADQGSHITVPQQELMLLLATGCATPPLQSFLCARLGEANLRRLARGIDAASTALHTVLAERLVPLAELALLLLGELRGVVACAAADEAAAAAAAGAAGAGGEECAADSGNGTWMGLQAGDLQQLELQAALLLLRAEQLRRCVTSVACQYRAFFSWLLKTLRQLDGGQADGSRADGSDAGLGLPQTCDVMAFLKGQFVHDLLGPELTGAARDADSQVQATAAFYQGIPPEEAHQLLALMLPGGGDSSTAAEAAMAASRHPLARQLAQLASGCSDLQEQPVMVASPAIQPVTQLQLLAGQGPQQRQQVAAGGGSGGSGGPVVAVALPLLQPAACEDLRVYVACAVPTQPSEAEEQQQQQMLLVVRLPAPPAQQQVHRGAPPRVAVATAEAVLLQLEAGDGAAAVALYKGQQLVLLTQAAAADAAASAAIASPGHAAPAGSSTLHLVELAGAPWTTLQQQQQQRPLDSSCAVQQCLAVGALVPLAALPRRSRALAAGAHEQLSVSRARGLASLVSDMQHLLLLDLEEDEEAEGDEEDDGMDE